MSQVLERWRFSAIQAVVVAVAVSSCAFLALVTQRGHAAAAAPILAAAVCAVGLVEVLRHRRRGAPTESFRRWAGAALAVLGAGQLLAAWQVLGPARTELPVGLWPVSLGAVVLVVAAVSAAPRAPGFRPTSRLLSDAGLLTASAALVIWWFWLAPVLAPLTGAGAAAAVLLLAELMIVSMILVISLRNLEPGQLAVTLGAAGFLVGDLFLVRGAPAHPQAVLWPAQLLWVLAWTPATWEVIRRRHLRAGAEDRADPTIAPDARASVLITALSLLLLAGAVAGFGAGVTALQPRNAVVDPVSWALLLTAILLLFVREVLGTRLRAWLLGRLRAEVTTDPLTGLANRQVLTTRLAEIVPGEPWCLVLVDLDGFKGINDLLGQAVGDRLLCAVGNRLVFGLPPTALVARTGGDEFAVLIPGQLPGGVSAAGVALDAVRRSCRDVEGVARLPITASVGVAAVAGVSGGAPVGNAAGLVGQPGTSSAAMSGTLDPLAALSSAAAALQLAKSGGRDRIEVFDGVAALTRSRRLSVEERLRSAIRAGEIDVRFQPIVELATGRITGVEALARWTDGRLGTINPQEFIPVAEQTGLVIGLGELVLDRSLQQARMHGLDQRGIRVSCNVSPLQLRVPTFQQTVEDALERYGMPPQSLVIEVTEAVLVEEASPAVTTLRRLAEAGVTIAIDDFGTGYSALGYLRRLPAQVLKIDRSLTIALADEPQARAITRAIVGLGQSLGVSIVVEGIETSDVAELVRRMGVGSGQGTLYGSAMPMTDIIRLSRRPVARDLPA